MNNDTKLDGLEKHMCKIYYLALSQHTPLSKFANWSITVSEYFLPELLFKVLTFPHYSFHRFGEHAERSYYSLTCSWLSSTVFTKVIPINYLLMDEINYDLEYFNPKII